MNKAELEAVSGKEVRSFSLPYGSATDLTKDLLRNLQLSGHEAMFLSEGVANQRGTDRFRFDRVSIQADKDDTLFFEIEVLPRLRLIRNRLFRSLWVRSGESRLPFTQPVGGSAGKGEWLD